MQIFLDTANIDEIKKGAAMGVLDGVTTNPTLVAREQGKPFEVILKQILKIVDGPISAEVISTDAAGMVKEAEKYAKMHKNIYVKIPLIDEGLKASKILSKKGIKINCTLCFSAAQALLAAKAGATLISPFIGRIDDINYNGLDLIAEIRQIYDNYKIKTKILAASIRSPRQFTECALLGADIITLPYKVFEKLSKHPLTDIGLQRFLDDWEKYKKQAKR